MKTFMGSLKAFHTKLVADNFKVRPSKRTQIDNLCYEVNFVGKFNIFFYIYLE